MAGYSSVPNPSFLKEGQDSVYNRAAYGGLRVDNKGQSLLVGLYDKDFRQIKPYRGKQ